MFLSTEKWYVLQATFLLVAYYQISSTSSVILTAVTLERTRSLTLLFSTLQCVSETDEETKKVVEINKNFDPGAHLNEYQNPRDVEQLLRYVNGTRGAGQPKSDDPFTNSPQHISQLTLILNVLYPNTQNWPLFYNTSVWLLYRVNSAQLFWSLMFISGEKFPNTVLVPTAVEVFPQLFINRKEVGKVAGITYPESNNEPHPLHYYTGDPGLNEFHTNWHIDNPFWFNDTKYMSKRDRRGELFLYMHHQIVTRYQAELLSNGLGGLTSLELEPDYVIPEEYYPDVVNINYRRFPVRRRGERMRDYDDGTSLRELKTFYDRLNGGVEQGYFMRRDGSQESLHYDNSTNILGQTMEASATYSANSEYYGSFHNYLHRFLGGMSRPNNTTPGVVAHSETAMRDPVFYRLHKLIDDVYYKLKVHTPAYTRHDLDYPGIQVKSVELRTPNQSKKSRWPFQYRAPPPTLTTYFRWVKYDISTAARPCRGIGEASALTTVKTLDHVPFTYAIALKSTKNTVSYGMIRIFLLPEYDHDGRKLEADESHQKAVELDRFRVKIDANKDFILTRSSANSSITRENTPPGIKSLYEWTSKSDGGGNHLFRPKTTRACGYPHNLLIPKGNKDGLRFKLTVMVSEEPEPEGGYVSEYPNYPYCGALNGYSYSDIRAMGYPFDRPGTRFISYEGVWAFIGGYAFKNVKQIQVVIKHQENF